MHRGSDSDEDNAMAYFLPNGIADDSPPKRSVLPAGSFGPIGGRTPTAAAGLTGGGFHRSNSPSYLHLNASPGASASASASGGSASMGMNASSSSSSDASLGSALLSGATGASSSLGGGSFRLADLGGEIHQPRASDYSGVTDASSASIGPFGYARSFRSGGQNENEMALRADSIFGRASGDSMAASSVGGNPFAQGISSSTTTTGASFFNRSQSDMASPFAQDSASSAAHAASTSSAFGGVSRNWPSATSAAQGNPRRVFQAPPGLGSPDIEPPGLSLGGGDYLSSRLMGSSNTSGIQQQQQQQQLRQASSNPFGAYTATATSAGMSDAFRSSSANGSNGNSSSQFGSSLNAPLSALHLSSDVFASSPQLLTSERRAKVTNPDLAELNSHSMKMNPASEPFIYQGPSVSSPQVGSPSVKEIQSVKVDVQARVRKSKPLQAQAQPYQLGSLQQQQQQHQTQSQKRVFDKKKQGALSDFSPMSPTSYREMLVSPATSGRVENRQGKSVSAPSSQLKASVSSPTAAPRSSPAALADTKSSSSRSKKRAENSSIAGGGLRPNRSGVESFSGVNGATGDADYESSDSADFTMISDSGDSPNRKAPDSSRKLPTREKAGSARPSKKERPPARGSQEKTPAGSTRRQVYREKQPKGTAAPQHEPQSSDELEATDLSAQAPKSEARESKPRARRAKDSETAAASDASKLAESKSAARLGGVRTLDRTDSSDVEISKEKGSPKQIKKPSAREKNAKLGLELKPKPSAAASQAATSDASRVESPAALASETETTTAEPVDKKHADASPRAVEQAEAAAACAEAAQAAAKSSNTSDDESDAAGAVKRSRSETSKDTSPTAKRSAAETPPNEEISPTEPPSQIDDATDSSSEHVKRSTRSEKKQPPLRKEKSSSRREKAAEKKSKTGSGKQRKEKRDSPPRSKGESFDVSDISDLDTGLLADTPVVSSSLAAVREVTGKLWRTAVAFTLYVAGIFRSSYGYVSSRLNIKGVLGTVVYHVESVAAVVFSVLLLLSLHGASWFIRIHRVAFRAILTHRHIGFCFAFLYAFPFLVQYVFPWAPPWAPVCLWYAFLVQLFCTNGPTAMVTTFRILLPLVFLVEGISHHSFLLDLNGAELLLASFIISALKTSNLCSPIFFISLAAQCLSAVFLGSELVVQWFQMALALYSLHSMVASEDDWNGFGDDEEELSCQSMSMHHSIADYNHHPAPSAASIQKTKRLDRRALAYVRGRKFR